MTISNKLLTEQAWSLQTKLNRYIELEKIKRIPGQTATVRLQRLNSLQRCAYSRYLRRLKKLWG
ncbi:MAG: hypothetical protein ABSB19_11715 [Methylomonas sp.]